MIYRKDTILRSYRKYFALLILALIVLAGCFSPFKGEGSAITINLAGGGRAAYPPDEATRARLVHTITLTGPGGGVQTHTLRDGEMSLTVEAAAGTWTILVLATLDGESYATASATAEVLPGQTVPVELMMEQVAGNAALPVAGASVVSVDIRYTGLTEATRNALFHTIIVSGGSGGTRTRENVRYGETVSFSVEPGEWTVSVEARLGSVLRAQSSQTQTFIEGSNIVSATMTPLVSGLYKVENGNYILELAGPVITGALDDALGPISGTSGDYLLLAESDTVPPISVDAASLTIQGYNTDTVLALNDTDTGSMFTVNAGAALTLDHVTLKGNATANPLSNSPVVTVTGGKLVMKDGAMITGNACLRGGGVSVGNVGSFTGSFDLEGGSVAGNAASEGAGVYVDGGNVTMSGGEISGNRAQDNQAYAGGGTGVYIYGGTFTLKGNGKIHGNIDALSRQSWGGGVYVGSSGEFIMQGGEISGNTGVDEGGGVYLSTASATFSKTDGTIFGSNGGDRKNIAGAESGAGNGHAVYRLVGYPAPAMYRDTTVGPLVELYSTDVAGDPDWTD